jgi:hypothetical protein
VFANNDPLRVDPVINSIDEVIVCATIVCAVNVPRTVKLSADEAVAAYDAEIAFDAVAANDAVPLDTPATNDAVAAYDDDIGVPFIHVPVL